LKVIDKYIIWYLFYVFDLVELFMVKI